MAADSRANTHHGGRQNHNCIYEATATYRQRIHTGVKVEAAIDATNLSTRVVGASLRMRGMGYGLPGETGQ